MISLAEISNIVMPFFWPADDIQSVDIISTTDMNKVFVFFVFFCVRLLSSISHLVLDEIHERNLQSDVLLIVVKDLLNLRDDLKVILMSATLNAEKFSRYFGRKPNK